MVSSLAGDEWLAEQETNKDYVKELDRKIHQITTERKHVQDGEVIASTMITQEPSLTPSEKAKIAEEVQFELEQQDQIKEQLQLNI